MSATAESTSSWEWWQARRLRYNAALVIAGLVAFVCYVLAVEHRCANQPGVEITLFTTAAQAVAYLVAIGVANLCYSVGPLLEQFMAASRVGLYRRTACTAGFAFSVILPFMIPLLILRYGCASGPV